MKKLFLLIIALSCTFETSFAQKSHALSTSQIEEIKAQCEENVKTFLFCLKSIAKEDAASEMRTIYTNKAIRMLSGNGDEWADIEGHKHNAAMIEGIKPSLYAGIGDMEVLKKYIYELNRFDFATSISTTSISDIYQLSRSYSFYVCNFHCLVSGWGGYEKYKFTFEMYFQPYVFPSWDIKIGNITVNKL